MLRPIRLRHATTAVALAVLASFPLAGSASAQTDRDCPDLPNQAAAQAALDSAVGDPERLDRDGDGQACEDFPYSATTGPVRTAAPAAPRQVRNVPVGSVRAGDGSAAARPVASGGPALVGGLVVAGGLALAGAGGVAVSGGMLVRHRRETRDRD